MIPPLDALQVTLRPDETVMIVFYGCIWGLFIR